MTRILLITVLACAAFGQDYPAQSTYGNITGASASCTGSNCVYILMPYSTASAAIQVSGTFTATIQFESSVNGSTWASIAASNAATSATAAGIWTFTLSGQRYLRARASAYTSGPVRIDISASNARWAPPGNDGDLPMKSGTDLAASGIHYADGKVTIGAAVGGTIFPTGDAQTNFLWGPTPTGLTTAYDNVGIGTGGRYGALASLTEGGANVAVGPDAGCSNASGNDNIFIGDSAGCATGPDTGSQNVFIGMQSGGNFSSDPVTGSNNIGLGFRALLHITTGNSNIGIGDAAGASITTGSYNIYIGDSADPGDATSSHKLYIDSTGAATPLIGGDFAARTVQLNGAVSLADRLTLTPHTPASSAEACTAGTVSVDASYLYVCTATNTWKRAALSSF